MRLTLGALVAAALAFGTHLPAASARDSRLRPAVPSAVGFASDGVRYVAWQTPSDGPVTALDTATGRRWTAGGGGCSLEDPTSQGLTGGAGRFLVLCGYLVELLDVRIGTMTPLPDAQTEWHAVGSRYIEGRSEGTCRQDARERHRGQSCITLYDIASGAVSYRPQSAAPDLDRPGAPPICKAIRGNFHEERIRYSAGVTVQPGDHHARIVSCHGRAKLLAMPFRSANIQLRGGVLSWDTGTDVTQVAEPRVGLSGTLTAYNLRWRRRYVFPLPPIRVPGVPEHPEPGVFGYSTHTSNTVFWVAARTVSPGETGVSVVTSKVYEAKL